MSGAQGFVEVEGGRLWYEIDGGGEPLVLVHGFSLDAALWDREAAALAPSRRVIRYDLRGFGRSSTPVAGQPFAHAADLAALLDRLGVARADLCGLSLGGGVVVDFALAHPARVGKLALIDALIGGWAWGEPEVDFAAWPVGRRDGVEAARAVWLSGDIFAPCLRIPAAAAALRAMVERYSGWHWVNENPARWLAADPAPRLGEIAAPALVLAGELDRPDYRRIAETLAAGIPGARLVRIPGAGHMANLEAPEAVLAELRTFFTA